MVRPCVASGFAELAVSGLASMYPAFDWSGCAPGHHGYQRACVLINGQASIGPFGSSVFACAGKTDPPSLLILSQTSAGNGLLLRHRLAPHTSQFLCSSQGPFLRPGLQNVDRVARRGGQGRPSPLACGGPPPLSPPSPAPGSSRLGGAPLRR